MKYILERMRLSYPPFSQDKTILSVRLTQHWQYRSAKYRCAKNNLPSSFIPDSKFIPLVYKVSNVEYLTCTVALESLPSLLLCLTLHATATILSLWKCTHRYKFMQSYRILSNVPCFSSLCSYLPDQSSQGIHYFL